MAKLRSQTRRPLFTAQTADVLEHRTLLSGATFEVGAGETLTIPASQTGDVSVDAAGGATVVLANAAQVDSLVVNQVSVGNGNRVQTTLGHGSVAGSVTINGGFATDKLNVLSGATVGVLDFNGGEGADTLRVDALAQIDTLQFEGGLGNDRLDILGVVNGTTTLDTGHGNDLILIRDEARLAGSLIGTTGSGNDRVSLVGPSLAGVSVDFGSGVDLLFVRPGTTFDGEVDLDFGDGADRIWAARGGMSVTGNLNISTGSGTDIIRLDGFDVGGDQTIDLGVPGPVGRDTAIFGRDVIGGSSIVRFGGAGSVLETAVRDIGDSYQVLGGGGPATVDVARGSRVGDGGITIENFGRTDIRVLADVSFGGLNVRTGAFNDNVRIFGGSKIVGGVTGFTGGGQDLFAFLGGGSDITGDINANLGWGYDTFRADDLFLNGDLNLNLGFASNGIDRAFLANNLVFGSERIGFSTRAIVAETGSQDIRGDYTLIGRVNSFAFTADAGTLVGGNFELRNAGRTSVVAPFEVTGNARIIGGNSVDNFDLSNAIFRGGLDVSTDRCDDLVNLQDALIAGKASVLLGAGNDLFDNLGTFYEGPSFIDGGDGIDDILDPGNGFNVNFETADH